MSNEQYGLDNASPEELDSAGQGFLKRFNGQDYTGAVDFFNRLISPAQEHIKRHHLIEYLSAVQGCNF